MDTDSLEQLYDHCIAHDQDDTAPTEKDVMRRFFAHVNGVISVGEVLVDSGHVSADGIMFLRKALSSVHNVLEDDSIKLSVSSFTPTEKASTQTKKRKTAEKDAMIPESILPPILPTSEYDVIVESTPNPIAPISPSGRGNDWLQRWTNIIKKIPLNATTGKPAVWPSLLTKTLVHTFGYDGVNNVITMAEQIINNLDMLTIDATTSADGDVASPLRPLAIRLKQVWASSRGSAVTTANIICYHKLMAEDFSRLEQDTYLPETVMGQEWSARDSALAQTPQARSNFIISRVFAYLNPRSLTQKEKETEFSKLRKERTMAHNVGLFVKLFGFGIVPLMGKSAWKEAFPSYAAASSEQYLVQLLEQCPVLREICDLTDKNFYQYVHKREKIGQLPKNCINGLSVDVSRRNNHPLSYLLAAPGELEETAILVSDGARKMMTKEKNDSKSSEENNNSASGVQMGTAGEEHGYLAFLEG
ncbi:hypothetical protein M436DRAFT_84154 [Aureobasidium namibiae CBS 147.97]|uniref:Uncharacterized protein n=1 Tax=Aureobasidium namibiae CBS 147.97 TaxID=1043004 RepID=A0A074X7J6_9PEZI